MSKAFKSVGKVFKKIAKPLKKIAPIALAIAAPFALPAIAPAVFGTAGMFGALGPAMASGLGSFGGTLIGGGSFGDALKSGLISGGLAGIGGALAGKMGAVTTKAPIASGGGHLTGGLGAQIPGSALTTSGAYAGAGGVMAPAGMTAAQTGAIFQAPVNTGIVGNLQNIASKFKPGNILQAVKDNKGKAAAVGLAGAALLGSAGQKQQAIPDAGMDDFKTGKSSRDIMKANPVKYWLQNLTWQDPQGVTQGVKYAGGIPQFGVKEGGIIQAKEGGLLNGPGTGTSDSIKGHIEGDGGIKQPVRLSDGEFVIKANAVKNLGGGSTREGAKKLYALQRQWDNMAVA